MTLTVLLSFAQFTFVMAITPGPNNAMLAVSAVNFGFRRTLPHVAGVALGFPAMFITAGIGVGSLFELYPRLFLFIKILGLCCLVYMAWQMAQFDAGPAAASRGTSPGAAAATPNDAQDTARSTASPGTAPSGTAPPGTATAGHSGAGHSGRAAHSGRDRPFSFIEASAFQWLNPKAWTMVLVSVTTFTSPQSSLPLLIQILILASICLLCSIPSASIWACFGARIAPFLADSGRKRTFNRLMAILMVSAVAAALFL